MHKTPDHVIKYLQNQNIHPSIWANFAAIDYEAFFYHHHQFNTGTRHLAQNFGGKINSDAKMLI